MKAEAGAHINTTYASGVLEGQKAVGVQVPSGLSDNQVQLEIRASDTLLSALADAASQLQAPNATHNPAAAAAALSAPGAVTSAYTRASLSVPARLAQSNIERSVALQQIYSAQHVDGGWGAELDPSVGPSTLGDTASVLLAIRRQDLAWTEAGDASFPPVDNTVIARGLSFLAWESSRPLDSSPSRQLLEERARGFYVLTLYGASKAEMIRPFMVYASSGDGSETGKAQLSPAGQAWLALALWQAGNTDDALALTERLRKDHDAAQIDEAEAGPVLEALLTIRVESRGLKNDERATGTLSTQHSALGTPEEAETYVRALMETRQGAGWSSPAVSADALWALSRYAAAANEKSGTTPTMVLDDHAVQSSAQPDNPGTISIALSGNALHAGTNWLKLQAPTLYYSLTLRAVR